MKSEQLTMFRLGVAMQRKYPDDFEKFLTIPLVEVADFLNEHEQAAVKRGTSMEKLENVINQIVDSCVRIEEQNNDKS